MPRESRPGTCPITSLIPKWFQCFGLLSPKRGPDPSSPTAAAQPRRFRLNPRESWSPTVAGPQGWPPELGSTRRVPEETAGARPGGPTTMTWAISSSDCAPYSSLEKYRYCHLGMELSRRPSRPFPDRNSNGFRRVDSDPGEFLENAGNPTRGQPLLCTCTTYCVVCSLQAAQPGGPPETLASSEQATEYPPAVPVSDHTRQSGGGYGRLRRHGGM